MPGSHGSGPGSVGAGSGRRQSNTAAMSPARVGALDRQPLFAGGGVGVHRLRRQGDQACPQGRPGQLAG